MSQTFERQWTCHICGSAGLLAEAHAHCPNCSFPRSRVPHFPEWDDLVTVDAHRFSGLHTTCCGTGWSAVARYCGACGESLGENEQAGRPIQAAEEAPEVDYGLDLTGLSELLESLGAPRDTREMMRSA